MLPYANRAGADESVLTKSTSLYSVEHNVNLTVPSSGNANLVSVVESPVMP